MTNHDDLLRRVTIANPVPADVDLPDDLADSRPPIALLIDEGSPPDARPDIRAASRWRGPAIAVAAALAVAVAISVPLLLAGGEEGSPAADTAPTVTTTTPPPPTTIPLAPLASSDTLDQEIATTEPMTWDRIVDVAVFGGDEEQRMTDVATGNGVAVAVGLDDVGGDYDAAAWYSADGVTWNRVPHDEAVFGGDGHQQMNAVVAVESGFIAVGSEGGESDPSSPSSPPSDSFETHAAVWRSDDGVVWERVPHDDALSQSDTGLVMNDVAFDGSGLVAVGEAFHRTTPFATYRWGLGDPSSPTDVDIDVDAAVWRSVDGVVWSRVTTENQVFGGDTIRQSMNAVVVGGPGFVAVGQEGFDFLGFDDWTPIQRNNPNGNDHVTDNVAAVWTSPDGENWTRVATEPSLAHSGGAVTGWATMFGVTTHGSGLVAVGRDVWNTGGINEAAAVWLSPDGLNWQRAAVEGDQSGPDMHAVTATAEGDLVAGGGMFLYLSAGAWTSQDGGSTWVNHPHDDSLFGGQPSSRAEGDAFGAASIQGLSTFGVDVIAVGGMDGDAAVWVGTWNGGTDG